MKMAGRTVQYNVGELSEKVICYTWKITDVSQRSNVDCIYSPKFGSWCMKVFLKVVDHSDQSKNSLGIFLCNETSFPVVAEFGIFLLSANGKKLPSTRYGKKLFLSKGTKQDCNGSRFLLRAVMNPSNKFLIDDTLTVQCEIFLNDNKNVLTEQFEEQLDSLTWQRLKEFDTFERFFESAEGSDVTFVVDRKNIFAHKAFLIARSPVFAAMFNHNMRENNTNTVYINDISYNAFKELLRFIYAGKTSGINNVAKDLLRAAEKYSIEALKSICEDSLSGKLTVDNALSVLEFADLHNAGNLKHNTMNFIKRHSDQIVNSPRFRPFGIRNFDLMFEITSAIATANTQERKKRKME